MSHQLACPSLLDAVFLQNIDPPDTDMLCQQAMEACQRHNYISNPEFIQKVIQLRHLYAIHHGIIMVGPAGCGKSAVRKILMDVFGLDGITTKTYLIEPKSMSKDQLYGALDQTTGEWHDGLISR